MSYVRASILGTLAGGEVWSINPVFDPTGEFPGGVNQTALDAAALAIANANPGVTLTANMSTAATITGCRLEVRDDATDALIGISIVPRTTPLVGTGAIRLPAQCASVISLRTNTPGGSGRGRVYWPGLAITIGSTLRNNSTNTANMASDFKSYTNAMANALATNFPTIGFNLAVRSKTTHSTPHVVRLQVGDVVDTQRRRRDNLPEAYSTINIP